MKAGTHRKRFDAKGGEYAAIVEKALRESTKVAESRHYVWKPLEVSLEMRAALARAQAIESLPSRMS
jgi:hypothetical protein